MTVWWNHIHPESRLLSSSVPLSSHCPLQSSLSGLSVLPITSITLTLYLFLLMAFSLCRSIYLSLHFCPSHFLHLFLCVVNTHSLQLTLSTHGWTSTGWVQLVLTEFQWLCFSVRQVWNTNIFLLLACHISLHGQWTFNVYIWHARYCGCVCCCQFTPVSCIVSVKCTDSSR